jgi:hypothetical protein
MSEDTRRKDAFVEMVTAKALVDLRLSDYHPRSMLVVMDEWGVELIVNITMRVGREAVSMIFKYQMAALDRFATMDGWTGPTCSLRVSF